MTEQEALLRLARLGLSVLDYAQADEVYAPISVRVDALKLGLYASLELLPDATGTVRDRLMGMDPGFQAARGTVLREVP